MTYQPVEFSWTGDSMIPLPRYAKLCDKQFVVGEIYHLEVTEERSAISHRHFFASVREAWMNLPEGLAERFPTPDRLRRWCLIKAGFADEKSLVCESAVDAARFAALLMAMNDDAVVIHNGRTLKVFTAKSQSLRSMNKQEFQKSKQAVLDILADMLGTSVAELQSSTAA